jgi:hypothetical protein
MTFRGKFLTGIFISLFLIFLIFVVFIHSSITSIHWQNTTGSQIEAALGFKHGSPYVNGKETWIIEKVVRGGVMDISGAKEGDVPSMGMYDFYKLLWAGSALEY